MYFLFIKGEPLQENEKTLSLVLINILKRTGNFNFKDILKTN
jgi:hypothetical protein